MQGFTLDLTDTKARQEEGVWANFGDGQFLIASSSTIRFSRELSRLQMPFRRKIDNNTMDPADSMRIMSQALAATVLLDWKNVFSGSGNDRKEVPYSKDIAIKALESMDDLREFVVEFSTNLQNYKDEVIQDLGN